MPSNITITASANSTPPANTVVATCQLADGSHAQKFILTDQNNNLLGGSGSPVTVSGSVVVASGSAVITNQVSASISNSPSVIVSSGSVIVTNLLSASISNSPSVIVSSGSIVVTNALSASISNTACVIVASGSAVVTNALSASVSGGSIALLAGANVFGSASVIQSTPTGIGNAWPVKLTDGTDTVAVNSSSQLTVAISNASVTIVDGSGNVYGVSAASPLFITGGAAGGTSQADSSTFAEGVTNLTPVGGFFFDTAASLTACQVGVGRMTANRAMHVNLRDANGSQLGAGTASPLYASITNSPSVVVASGSVVVTNIVSASIGNSPSVVVSSGSVVVTNLVSASISNSPSVIVSSGSVVVTNALSASISNSPSVIVSSGSIVVTNGLSASLSNIARTDQGTFSEGASPFVPVGGMFFETAAVLSACQMGIARQTSNRAIHVNLRDASGSQLGAGSSSPIFASVTNSPSVVVASGSVVVTNSVSASISNSPSVIVSSGSVVVTNALSASISNTACVIVSSGSVVVTNALSASISNSPSVIVSSGSVVVTNALSASVSGGSVALLTGANVIGSASVIQSTPTGVANAWPHYLATNTGSVLGMSGSPLAVAADLEKIWFAGSVVSTSTINLSASATGCARIVASAAGQAIVILAATFTTSGCQNIGWVASGAGAASSLVQTPMPFATFGGMDANRMPHGALWKFPSGSNAILTTSTACNVAGTLTYIQVAS